MDKDKSERGKPASFDRRTGEVHGSGSGAGGEGNAQVSRAPHGSALSGGQGDLSMNEDYDQDSSAGAGAEPDGGQGTGHPLPGSDEARHNEIPEHLEREKGLGDDAGARVRPAGDAVNPDGEHYGRGPESASDRDDLEADQAEHQDRGQTFAQDETAGR